MSDNFRRHPATAKTPEAYASAIIIKIFENLDKVQFTKAEKLTSQNPSSARLLLPLAPVMDLNFQGRIDVTPFPIWSPVRYTIVIIDGFACSSTRSSSRSQGKACALFIYKKLHTAS